LFPPADSDALQLTFFPLLLAPGAAPPGPPSERDRELARRLRELSVLTEDPKADALDRLLGPRPEKAIVFVRPRATVRYLLRQPPRERALALEQRLAAKVSAQRAAGAAQVEAVAGPSGEPGALDWCDRLQRLPAASQPASVGACAGVLAPERAVALIVRIGA